MTACASATNAIGEAFRTIKYGLADMMVTGGTEATVCEIGIAGFAALNALNTTEDATRASIPFDKERKGFVMGEGAGMLVLEELEHAQKRGATIYGEIVGYGSNCDASHMTAPLKGLRRNKLGISMLMVRQPQRMMLRKQRPSSVSLVSEHRKFQFQVQRV